MCLIPFPLLQGPHSCLTGASFGMGQHHSNLVCKTLLPQATVSMFAVTSCAIASHAPTCNGLVYVATIKTLTTTDEAVSTVKTSVRNSKALSGRNFFNFEIEVSNPWFVTQPRFLAWRDSTKEVFVLEKKKPIDKKKGQVWKSKLAVCTRTY
jgi:hypothetical protein